jgi:hypothetical protein
MAVEHSAGVELVGRAKALAAGARYYAGSSCERCGESLRYALTRACVACTRRKSRAKSAGKAERRRQEGLAACKRLGIV